MYCIAAGHKKKMNAAALVYAVVRMHSRRPHRAFQHHCGSNLMSNRWFDSRLKMRMRLRELLVRPTLLMISGDGSGAGSGCSSATG